ncbi:MAG: PQQ-binding-like beta-propeller repeat protein [Acidobacteria bacterium]|nr:PQQ-binding-like beta-propeller repeat protein [Acidobacteriota bacterium]
MQLYDIGSDSRYRLIRWLVVVCLLFAVAAVTVGAQRRPSPRRSVSPAQTAAPEWPQWGGLNRNFKVQSGALKESWPAGGPKQLWSRPLGEGHSSILVDNGRLFTMYSSGNRETVICLDAATGKTLWEFPYETSTRGLNLEYGKGPHSTPLIVGNLIYSVGVAGRMHALDKRTGKLVWQHDLWNEYGGQRDDRGYSPSPIAYNNTVIVIVGGKNGQSLMAFDQQTGNVAWKNLNYTPAPASPVIINVSGQDQLIYFSTDEIVGCDPHNGAYYWHYPHKTEYGLNISTPVWEPDNLIFMSSAYGTGSRVIQLTRNGNQTSAKQVWANNRMRVHIGTVIRLGDIAYGSSGDFGPAPLTAINVKTGQIGWQDRSLGRASFLYADSKLILLDEDGMLMLAKPGASGLQILAKAQVMKNVAWTVPTLVGTILYVRDRRTILALELG